jgi:alkaline phosphatase D
MAPSRREFLKTSAAWAAAAGVLPLAAPLHALARREQLGTFPILQTMTNRSSAQFRVLVDTGKPYAFTALNAQGSAIDLDELDRFQHPADPAYEAVHLVANGLRPGQAYRLRVVEPASGKVLDERAFRALDTAKAAPRFAIASCMSDDFPDVQRDMWRAMQAQQPDVIFVLGDAAYLDPQNKPPTEESLWRRHVISRSKMDVFLWKTLRPVISVWDDHDYGMNNAGHDFPLKQASAGMFRALFGSGEAEGYEAGPGESKLLTLFGQRFFLMDCRSWRKAGEAHWGSEQEEWLLDRIGSGAEPAYLMNGSQYYGAYHGYDSFEKEHPRQLKRLMEALSDVEAPVVLCSGDVHFSELMRIGPEEMGYETYELTSSSIHSYYSQIKAEVENPRRLEFTKRYNFLTVDPRVTRPSARARLELRVRSIGRANDQIYARALSVAR